MQYFKICSHAISTKQNGCADAAATPPAAAAGTPVATAAAAITTAANAAMAIAALAKTECHDGAS